MARLKSTILCVGDRWNELVGRKVLLESTGYRVLAATDTDEGLRLFRGNAVDAAVLDYQMPGMKVDVVAAKMKRIRPHVPIVMLSSYWPLPKNKLVSVDAFLTKAQEAKLLLSTVGELLNRPKPFFHQWLATWRGRNRTVLP